MEQEEQKKLYVAEKEKEEREEIKEFGQSDLAENQYGYKIHLLNIIGEIEGHQCLGPTAKTTKYEHVLPELARVEENQNIDGLLILLNTVGGDVEAGLAIAEMVASLSIPVVTLVLGGGHSIGVPLSVSGDRSFIVPTATMVVHPIHMNGTVLGVKHNYEYIDKMQERIISFTCTHAQIKEKALKELMFNTTELAKDVGSVLVGGEAVKSGLIDKVGGISDAFCCLYSLINRKKNSNI
ncbi:MAG: ATP-dependent Clp protease proteolytic subunit [Bacteroidales bacterium]|nr:ATP-dependent Clp protease proteolytic subunit [Clostridium sp.]MCM1203108.1 ATP-dependent Clp protease proteolytic subunit [Bacteroidales bacterium]